MQLVDNDTFLLQLKTLFDASKEHGTIWLTHKRLTYDGDDSEIAGGHDDTAEYPCLLRASNGGKIKFSTRVEPGGLNKFYAVYGALLKSSMTTLRKRDKKREKTRAEQVARKKKKITEPVVVEGPKRGKGRRIRQRRIKAALKQQEAQQKFKEREGGATSR